MPKNNKTRFLFMGSCFFLFSFAFSFSNPISVNALTTGPNPHIEGETAYHLLAPSDNEISITSEDVAFDFTDPEINPYDDTQGLPGTLTTTLELSSSGGDKTIPMGFPVLTSFSDLPLKEIQITGSGGPISYEPAYGKKVNTYAANPIVGYEDPADLEDETLAQAFDQTLKEESYLDDSLMLTTYTIDSTQIHETDGVIKFKANPDQSTLFKTTAFSYKNNEPNKTGFQSITLTRNIAYYIPPVDIEFSILGQEIIDIEIFGTNDASETLVPYDTEDVLTISSVSLKDKIHQLTTTELPTYEVHTRQGDSGPSMLFTTLDPVIAERLLGYETSLALDGPFCQDLEDLVDNAWAYPRIILITIDVPLTNGANTLTITQPYFAGINRHYNPEVLELKYASNAAKKWSSFGSLTLSIVPPENYFVIENENFIEQEDGSFVYTPDTLPTDNIDMNLCTVENPEYRILGFFDFFVNLFENSISLITLVIAPAVTLAGIAVGITFIVRANKKHKKAITEKTDQAK